ncbi:MAG TPA: transglycosylase SLT domain-containing protein [Verrucomicrobiae bacterium]|nr:transglycosylase SLT domain-containing protein [Verrucomicrobiae bacterium]
MKLAVRLAVASGTLLLACLGTRADVVRHPSANASRKAIPRKSITEEQLSTLARGLKDKNAATAYARLGEVARRRSNGVYAERAALALGYYDYSKGNYDKAVKWFERAQGDTLLGDYTLYWMGEANLALGKNGDALTDLQQLRAAYPNSVMTEQALESLGVAALALHQAPAILTALAGYPQTTEKPGLLLLRGEAREMNGQAAEAAADYEAVYLGYPLSDESRQAEEKFQMLQSVPANAIPDIPLDKQLAHADALFTAKLWSDARSEYSNLLMKLNGAERERAELRVLECGLELGASPTEMINLPLTDPDVMAERSYTLASYYRNARVEAPMAAQVEAAASEAPQSRWAEQALFLAGNYYWVQLEREQAAAYYQRLVNSFPTWPEADPADWRITWTAVLQRKPEAAALLANHLQKYPGSIFTPDALYWLGRLAEDAGNDGLARSYYEKLLERFPENYFSEQAARRMGKLKKDDPAVTPDVLAVIPPAPPVEPLGATIPAAAEERQARANALSSIGFDSSAELELKAGYAETGEPRLLLEAAEAAAAGGNYGGSIVTVRQIVPELESRAFADVPRDVWKAAYPLPFQGSIFQWSGRAGVDPMLTLGLIKQESAFSPEARSGANAMGLMQLLPKTARRMARQARLRYARRRLFEADYNIRLGTIYLSGLLKGFGGVEAALAAYNAGEDHVAAWTSGQNYREPAEFVDSIPFTETREYVEIVTRNAEIYRKLYGEGNERTGTTTSRGR